MHIKFTSSTYAEYVPASMMPSHYYSVTVIYLQVERIMQPESTEKEPSCLLASLKIIE